MLCPYCKSKESRVLDSRSTSDGRSTRRRRQCLKCSGRFTTYEAVESIPILVMKRDGSRQRFDRDKLVDRLIIAFGKRRVDLNILKNVV